MLVLKQNNSGFVNMDNITSVYAVQTGTLAGRIAADTAYGRSFWLGDYDDVERANAIVMNLYAAMKVGHKDYVMPPRKVCNEDYCDI